MGLFEKAGRRFEQFKQEAKAAAEEEAEYECRACETKVYTPDARCPECGADDIVPVEPTDDSPEDAAESPEDDPDSSHESAESPDERR